MNACTHTHTHSLPALSSRQHIKCCFEFKTIYVQNIFVNKCAHIPPFVLPLHYISSPPPPRLFFLCVCVYQTEGLFLFNREGNLFPLSIHHARSSLAKSRYFLASKFPILCFEGTIYDRLKKRGAIQTPGGAATSRLITSANYLILPKCFLNRQALVKLQRSAVVWKPTW